MHKPYADTAEARESSGCPPKDQRSGVPTRRCSSVELSKRVQGLLCADQISWQWQVDASCLFQNVREGQTGEDARWRRANRPCPTRACDAHRKKKRRRRTRSHPGSTHAGATIAGGARGAKHSSCMRRVEWNSADVCGIFVSRRETRNRFAPTGADCQANPVMGREGRYVYVSTLVKGLWYSRL